MSHTALPFLVLMAAGSASAHVAPSVSTNNRYLSVTVSDQGIRLGYTLFYGQVPGYQLRQSMDKNGDSALSAEETSEFLATESVRLADGIAVEVGNRRYNVSWQQQEVGLGKNQTASGDSFRIDLATWLCLPEGGSLSIQIADQNDVEPAGETEVRVQGGPGVSLTDIPKSDPTFSFSGKWTTSLRFGAELKKATNNGPNCLAPEPQKCPPQLRKVIFAAVLLVACLAAIFFVYRRRINR